MSDYIKKIRTKDGDKQIDYGSLANLPSFKTINGESIIGSGDIKVETESDENQNVDLSGYAKNTDLDKKQDKLVSGTNIKTINGESILGSGNLLIDTSGYKNEDLITRYEPINKNVFKDKKLWVFGDSITAGVGTSSPYYFPNILAENLGCASITKKGNSGYAFSHGIDDYGSCILDKMTDLDAAPGNCDILIVCFGVNDWTWGRNIEGDRAIGNLLDTTKYTICGAVNLFCQKLQEIFADYPDVKIYFSTPTPTKNAPISGGNPSGKTWDQTKQNYNGNTLRDICNAIIRTVALYGYQTLDLNLYFDGDVTDHSAMDVAFPDGLHPNEEGNTKIANTLEKLLVANPITAYTFNPLVSVLSPLAKNMIYKEVLVVEAEEPTITLQPVSASYEIGDVANKLEISASVSDGGVLTYQWYKNGSAISGETESSYTPSTETEGEYSYYCLVTNTHGNKVKSKTSNTAIITITSEEVVETNEIDLSTLTLAHMDVDSSGEENLSYNQDTNELVVNTTGWYKSSYFTTPLHVGDEIEFTTNFSNTDGTTGNAILVYSESNIATPTKIANSYWPGTSIFGLYAPGTTGKENLSQWDSSKVSLDGYPDTALYGVHTVKLKLTTEGVRAFINDAEVTLSHYNKLSSDTNYYFGMHSNTTGKTAITLKYIGTQR